MSKLSLTQPAPIFLQPFFEFTLPLGVVKGMREEVKPVLDAEVMETIGGRTVVLPAPTRSKLSFRLSCSGPGVMCPPRAAFYVGRTLRYRSSIGEPYYMNPWAEPEDQQIHQLRKLHDVIITAYPEQTSDWTGPNQGWVLDFREVQAS